MPRGVYVVKQPATSISTGKTLLQYKAGSAAGARVLRAVISQTGSTTSTEQEVGLGYKTAAATVTAFTPLLTSPNDAAALGVGGTSATGYNASDEGTDGDFPVDDTWNILTPWVWVPTPLEQVEVAPGGIIALKLLAAPASALIIKASLWVQEYP